MFSACPKCQTRLSVEMKHLDEDTAIVCTGCRSILKTKLTIEIIAESNRPSAFQPAASHQNEELSDGGSARGKKVLICIDGEGTRDLIKEILTEDRFDVVDVASGAEVLSSVQRHRPAVVLIDVGLSDMLGTELCGAIRKDPRTKDSVVILVASIYDKNTKYRRQPDSLFGADDHIERHHIQKDLLAKIKRHLAEKPAAEAPLRPPAKEPAQALKEAVRRDPILKEKSLPPSGAEAAFSREPMAIKPVPPAPNRAAAPAPAPPKEQEDAKRLARIIVSDIVLYNKKKVDEGIRTNTFFEILKEEIEEGRKHYLSRVSAEIQKAKDYYKEAFDEFISKRNAATSK